MNAGHICQKAVNNLFITITHVLLCGYCYAQQDPAPQINGPRLFGARPDKIFIYPVPVSGAQPIQMEAKGLPATVQFDTQTGIITGKIHIPGNYPIKLTVKNKFGKTTRVFSLVIGDRLALTPPMGWSSWYSYGRNVTQKQIELTAKLMKEKGLQQLGWTLLEVDDPWANQPAKNNPVWAELKTRPDNKVYHYYEGPDNLTTRQGAPRDGSGNLVPSSFFPNLKGMTETLHRQGFKAGIYSSPGPLTCGGAAGSYNHELQDAKFWSDMGFDYLKYDWCSYGVFAKDTSRAEYIKPYKLMAGALQQQQRDIIFSLCQYGMGNVWEWGNEAGGQLWRTEQDIRDNWSSIHNAMKKLADKAAYVKPGNWNDPDILQIGTIGGNDEDGKKRANHLSAEEQKTHFSMWCMLSAPLLIGANMEDIDEATLRLLQSQEMIAVDQDALGKAAKRLKVMDNQLEIWQKPMEDGSFIIALLNASDTTITSNVNILNFELPHLPATITDLWAKQTAHFPEGDIPVNIPSHGIVILKCNN